MTYKQALTSEMTRLGRKKGVYFLGYNTRYGSRMYGTLQGVPKNKCIEMPVAENLIVGVAMGMSLEGYLPIVCFERMDFMMCAMDAIVNHLDKMPYLSGDQFSLPLVIRCCVGHTVPLDPGIQHTSDYTTALIQATHNISISSITNIKDISIYKSIESIRNPHIIVEYKVYYKEDKNG